MNLAYIVEKFGICFSLRVGNTVIVILLQGDYLGRLWTDGGQEGIHGSGADHA